ncbi:MAG TPA: hypothetical protein VF881_08465 [Polyangiaceae bacterium]
MTPIDSHKALHNALADADPSWLHPANVCHQTATHRPPGDGVDTSGPLSMDMLLEYVAMRLESLDGQIEDFIGEANEKKAQSDELRRFQQGVRSVSGYDSSGFANKESLNEEGVSRVDAERLQVADPELKAKLDDLAQQIHDTNRVKAEDVQPLLDYAKDRLASLNSDNEITMMRLNSIVQLRSQVIGSASNVQASINEGMKTVIGNMRA